jgi:ribosome-binding factor A
MSNRTVRIAELVQRELGDYLHTRYRSEAVMVTVTGVEVAPDLKTGRIFFGILGDAGQAEEKMVWVQSKRAEIRRELAKRIPIKHSPQWELHLDHAAERGSRILSLLDELKPGEPDPGSDGKSAS